MEQLACNGGYPVRNKPFRDWPVFGNEEREKLLSVFDSGRWWYGETVKEFEGKYAAFQNARFGVSCTNGTAALEIALSACGVGAGDEVIVPPYTFMATAGAVLKANAVPIFADIELDTCNLDPEDTQRKMTEKTKAIIPVHLGGLPVDMDAFTAIARKHKLKIIEDACHSWGSKWNGKGTGALGDCGAFSFQMGKNITSGEGGIMLTDNEEIAETARSYSNCGRREGKEWYEHFVAGSNLRLTELQAAILLGQLTRLDEQTQKREANAAYLDERLRDISGLALQKRDKRVTRRSYHMYAFRFLEEEWSGVSRDRFLKALNAEGIPCGTGYPIPLYKNMLFARGDTGPGGCSLSCPYYGRRIDYGSVVCANAERICAEACWIPHPVLLTAEEDMEDIVRAIEKIWENREVLQGA